jgi:hypothetical protein
MVADRARLGHRNPALTGANWLIATAATLSAAVLATILAIVFAATLAVITVVVAAVLGAWAVAYRLGHGPKVQVAAQPVTLEARKVGHAWVAYGWDQSAR